MTFDPSDKEIMDLNTGRLMRSEADVILPLLEKQRNAAVAGICNSFRSGKLEMLPMYAATLVSIEDMKSEIKNKIAVATNIERKIHASTDR